MKTGQSDQYPEIIVKSVGLTQIRYDIQPFTRQDMDGKTISGYSYKYAEIDGEIDKSKLISAIIRNEYDENGELALIHNLLNEEDTKLIEHVNEYKKFQKARGKAKLIVTEMLKTMG